MGKHRFLAAIRRWAFSASVMSSIVTLAYIFCNYEKYSFEICWVPGVCTFVLNTLILMGLAGILCSLLYPMRRGSVIGDLVVLLVYGILPSLGIAYAVTGELLWDILWCAFPTGMITSGIFHSYNTRGKYANVRIGTTAVMGTSAKMTALVYSIEVLCPFVWVGICSIFGLMPLTTLLIFLTLPVAIACSRTRLNVLKGGTTVIGDLDMRSANLQAGFSLLLTLALVLGRFI